MEKHKFIAVIVAKSGRNPWTLDGSWCGFTGETKKEALSKAYNARLRYSHPENYIIMVGPLEYIENAGRVLPDMIRINEN